jgi:hypothetical protein
MENVLQTEDGTEWNRSVALFDKFSLCHRHETGRVEFSIVERWPWNETSEIMTKGEKVMEVLRDFVREQRHALQLWTADVAAQVGERMAEKYSGHDMNRAADGFMHRFTHPILRYGKIIPAQQQQSRGIGV